MDSHATCFHQLLNPDPLYRPLVKKVDHFVAAPHTATIRKDQARSIPGSALL
jgi:hypothetical protein